MSTTNQYEPNDLITCLAEQRTRAENEAAEGKALAMTLTRKLQAAESENGKRIAELEAELAALKGAPPAT